MFSSRAAAIAAKARNPGPPSVIGQLTRWMSAHGAGGPAPLTPLDLAAMKRAGDKIVMSTAYDYFSGCLVHGVGQAVPPPVHITLVGDSLGMVMLGQPDTRRVTVDQIAQHCASVAAAAKHPGATCKPFLVADMPFGSYTSPSAAVDTAVTLMREGGAGGVKLEGAGAHLPKVAAIVGEGIPVMGHLGLLPQVAASHSGMRLQCRSSVEAHRLLSDAQALVQAGASSLVLEMVPRELGQLVAAAVPVPVIGIGAGGGTDGQVLVLHDFTGMNPNPTPGFTHRFADAGRALHDGVAAYASAVGSGAFPSNAHSHRMAPRALGNLAARLQEEGWEVGGLASSLAASAAAKAADGSDVWRSTPLPPPAPGLTRVEVAVPGVQGGEAGCFRVAVVGSGAMGRMLAGHLARAGVAVTLCPGRPDSPPPSLPLHASLLVPSDTTAAAAPTGVEIGEVGSGPPPDLVLVAVKSGGVQGVLDRAQGWLDSGAVPAVLANGVSHLPLLPPGAGAVVTSHGAFTTPLPHDQVGVVQAGHGKCMVGGVESGVPPHPALHRLASALQGAGLGEAGQAEEGVSAAAVRKLAVNCALNPMTVVLDAPNGALQDLSQAGQALLDSAVEEALQAAAATGLPLPDCPPTFTGVGGWDVVRDTAGNVSSTLADVRGGRETELPVLNEWVVGVLGHAAAPANAQLGAAARLAAALR